MEEKEEMAKVFVVSYLRSVGNIANCIKLFFNHEQKYNFSKRPLYWRQNDCFY